MHGSRLHTVTLAAVFAALASAVVAIGLSVVGVATSDALASPQSLVRMSGRVSASSSAPGHPAVLMIDRLTSTSWRASSRALPQQVTLDLGSPRVVKLSVVVWKVSGRAAFRIYGSNDRRRWRQLANGSANRRKNTRDPVSGTWRYLRLRIGRVSAGRVGISEWRVYGPATGFDLTRALKAAKPGDTVNVPAGTYSFSSRLRLPGGVNLTGVGNASWIKGPVIAGANATYANLRIGAHGISTYVGASNVRFNAVEFSGGGGAFTSPYYNSNMLVIGAGASTSGITFNSCQFDTPMGTEASDLSLHMDTVFIDRAQNVNFTNCHFLPSLRFTVEVWDGDPGGSRHVNFTGCHFARSAAAAIDYSTSYGGYSTVDACSFQGNGAAAMWPDDVTIEQGASHIAVENCDAERGRNMFVGGSGGHNAVINNLVSGDSGIAHSWMPYIALIGDYNAVTGNEIDVGPNDPDTTVLGVHGNNNVVTGNTITTPAGWSQPILVVTGSGNTSSPNTVNGVTQ